MHEGEVMDTNGGFAACTAGLATSGSITIGNITTPVTEPVNVQFGFFIPPGDVNFYPAPAPPPLAGVRDPVHQAGPDPGEPDHGAGL
jgi:hypothetical protein